MDKKELSEKIKYLPHHVENKAWVCRDRVLNLVEQLDEPQKPVVKQFIANWYEQHKNDFEFAVFNYLYTLDTQEETSFKKWFIGSKTKTFQTLVKMHLFGYEVEKEKKYIVRVKGIDGYTTHLNKNLDNGAWFFASDTKIKGFRVEHTREDLEKAGFGEVFNSPLFEVREV